MQPEKKGQRKHNRNTAEARGQTSPTATQKPVAEHPAAHETDEPAAVQENTCGTHAAQREAPRFHQIGREPEEKEPADIGEAHVGKRDSEKRP